LTFLSHISLDDNSSHPINKKYLNLDITFVNPQPISHAESLENHHLDDLLLFELYGNDCSSNMDEASFLQEDLYL